MDAPPAATRRRLLLWAAFAASAAGLATFWGRARKEAPFASSTMPVLEPETNPAEAATLDPASLPIDGHPVYSPLLNTEFTIDRPDEATERCRLVAVSTMKTLRTPKGDFTAFSLLFEAKSGYLREGGICRVGHPELETMELFLSPVGRPDGGKTFLEAVFTQRA